MDWNANFYAKCHTLYEAGMNYGIPEDWLAGLVFVECASIAPQAHRLEAAVLKELYTVIQGGTSTAFPGFNESPIQPYIRRVAKTSVADITALASSWGIGQIMGYQYFTRWKLVPREFTNLSLAASLDYTLRLMAAGLLYARQAEPSNPYEALLRWWNTGRAAIPSDGKEHTYSPTYIPRAVAAQKAYKDYLNGRTY